MIIALVNKKGGAGKSTSCAHIAMCLHTAGHKVTGIDTDSNRTFSNMKIKDKNLPFDIKAIDPKDLKDTLKNIEGYVVIDTPPNDEAIIYKVASLADEVIIPLAPTEYDVNQIEQTSNIVADIEEIRGDISLTSVLLTRYDSRFSLVEKIRADLKDREIPVCDAMIRYLARYTEMGTPTYLDEYQAFLTEIGVL